MSRRHIGRGEKIPPELEETPSSSGYESTLFAAELGEVPELDLHQESRSNALKNLEDFLYQQQFAGSEAVRIIHGKGQNILAPAVRQWLDQQVQMGTLVAAYQGSNRPHEQGAVVLVALVPIR